MQKRLWRIGPLLAILAAITGAPPVHAQTKWTECHLSCYPCIPGRYQHAMAYDSARRRVVLFGGTGMTTLNDTWEWDGKNWRRRVPAISPPPMAGHTMAYDAARGRTVLFGRNTASLPYQTWEWDGTTWTQCTPATRPPDRSGSAMAYDANLQRVILFGGSVLGNSVLNDTWAWDGTRWTQQIPAAAPPARHHHAMAYDAARKRIVLFGGRSGSYLNDTWEWQGTTWIPCPTPVAPSPREFHAMAYDVARQRVVLFGGSSSYTMYDTWEWDGKTWVQPALGLLTPGRSQHAMAHDTAHQRTILFGGYDGGIVVYGDTWAYGSTHLSMAGQPRPGHVMTFTLSALLDAGRPYQLGSSLGAGPTWVGPVIIDLDMDALLVVSVAGVWPGVFQGYRGFLDGSGQATAVLQIPPFPLLAGITVHSAFLTFDANPTLAIRSVSKTVSLQVMP